MSSKILQLAKLILCPLAPFLFLTACEDTNAKLMTQAQECLDKATPSTASGCSQIINGLTTPDSYSIRCSVDFLSQGFTSARYVDAFQDISATNVSGSSTRPALEAIGFMNFPAAASAAQALSDCAASNSDSLRRIAELAQVATTLAPGTYNSTTPSDSVSGAQAAVNADYGNAFSCVANNSSTAIATGTEAVAIYEDFCVTGSPFQSSDICTTFTDVFSSGVITPTSPPAVIGCGFMKAVLNAAN